VLDLVVVFLFTHPLMAVLARFRSFGTSRFSGLGRVDRTLRSTGPRIAAEPELVGAGSGRGARRPQDRSRA
jgi:preprotein translocase subunit SecD